MKGKKMAHSSAGIFLVHGAWHNAQTWKEILSRLRAEGFIAEALDLPGAGANAAVPKAYDQRPLDPAAFATEPSPNAKTTQQERTAAVMALVDEVAEKTGRPVVLVGHSMGGVTVSQVAEAAPEKISAAVYLTAFMLPPGLPAGAMIGDTETMSNSLVKTLLLADPQKVGALRLDPRSEDTTYRARLKETFYGDVSDAQFEAAAEILHPDEPASVAGVPSPITPENFGSIPRHYIHCTEDRAIVMDGQRKMVALVDAAMPSPTIQHTLVAGHSPFLSMPDDLAAILAKVAT